MQKRRESVNIKRYHIKRYRGSYIAKAAIMLVIFGGSIFPLSASEKLVNLLPVSDAMVVNVTPNVNFGTHSELTVAHTDNYIEQSFIRFDLTGIPRGSEIKSAVLRLNALEILGVDVVGIRKVTSQWTESSVTWTTKPTFDNTWYDFTQVRNLGWNEWGGLQAEGPFIQMIQSWVDTPEANFGLALIRYRNAPMVGIDLASREHQNAPLLSLSYTETKLTANLSIRQLSFQPNQINPNAHPSAVNFQLHNFGPNNLVNGKMLVIFYLSRDNQFSEATDTYIGDVTLSDRIDNGWDRDIVLNQEGRNFLTIPNNAEGPYYVIAKVQHAAGSPFTDTNPNNNMAASNALVLRCFRWNRPVVLGHDTGKTIS